MNKIFVRIIVPIWVLFVIINFAIPNKEFSKTENRMLKKFPTFSMEELINGEFMKNIDDYVNDHFIGRDYWVGLKTNIDLSIGKRESNGIYIGKQALIEHIKEPDNEYVQKNIEGISSFMKRHPQEAYFMLIPSASEIQPQKLPPLAPTWNQKALIDDVYSKLPSSITPIDAYGALSQHKDEYIYYRTDHHWTSKGAYYAYVEASKTMGIAPKSLTDFTIKQESNQFYGTLSSKSGIRTVPSDIIESYDSGAISTFSAQNDNKIETNDSIYFNQYLKEKDKYSFFLGLNQPIVTIQTNSNSGKKLLLFKDSYSHCYSQFLTQDYSEIVLLDMRYINGKIENIVTVEDYDQILFMYSIDMFTHQNQLLKLK